MRGLLCAVPGWIVVRDIGQQVLRGMLRSRLQVTSIPSGSPCHVHGYTDCPMADDNPDGTHAATAAQATQTEREALARLLWVPQGDGLTATRRGLLSSARLSHAAIQVSPSVRLEEKRAAPRHAPESDDYAAPLTPGPGAGEPSRIHPGSALGAKKDERAKLLTSEGKEICTLLSPDRPSVTIRGVEEYPFGYGSWPLGPVSSMVSRHATRRAGRLTVPDVSFTHALDGRGGLGVDGDRGVRSDDDRSVRRGQPRVEVQLPRRSLHDSGARGSRRRCRISDSNGRLRKRQWWGRTVLRRSAQGGHVPRCDRIQERGAGIRRGRSFGALHGRSLLRQLRSARGARSDRPGAECCAK
jgi:hypothetical protein